MSSGGFREVIDLAVRLQQDLAPYVAQPADQHAISGGSPTVDGFVDEYDHRIKDEALRTATRKRFLSKHYSDAVEAGVKALNERVRQRSGSIDDGDSLMTNVLSQQNPILRVNDGTTKSHQSEQRGYMNLCAGVVGAWRNPRAHSTDIEDSPESALMMLETIDHLMAVVAEAKRTRSRKKAPKPGP